MNESEVQAVIDNLNKANKNFDEVISALKLLVKNRETFTSESNKVYDVVVKENNSIDSSIKELNEKLNNNTNLYNNLINIINEDKKEVDKSKDRLVTAVYNLKKDYEDKINALEAKLDKIISALKIEENNSSDSKEENNSLDEIIVKVSGYVKDEKSSSKVEPRIIKNKKGKLIILKGLDKNNQEFEFTFQINDGENLNDINNLLENKEITIYKKQNGKYTCDREKL